ncbi:MAG: MarR family winged helix-turn-helix transcriptional regulator [Arenimonas sp.]
MTADLLDLEHFLPYRLSVLSNRISQDIAALYAERFNLGITEWRIIAILGRYPDLSANEVAERTAMDKVAVSRAVASLLKQKRLKRKFDKNDLRRSVLSLSAAGDKIYAQVAPLAKRLQDALLVDFDDKERVLLNLLLDKLAAAELSVHV